MSDLLKELLEEFPELKEDSDKIERVIQYLEKSKPNIEASMEFKDSLRKRLDNIIEIKEGKKKHFWYYIIPAFSLCLVLSLMFVYYKDISKVENQFNGIESNGSIELKMDSLKFIGDEGLIELNDNEIIKEDGVIEISQPESSDLFDKSADFKELDVLINESEIILMGETLPVEKNNNEQNTNEKISVSDEKLGNEVEDVMNLLNELFNGIEENNAGSKIEESIVEQVEKVENMPDNNLPVTGGGVFSGVYSFKEFCDYQKGFTVNTGKGVICRKRDGTECSENSFNGVNCDFVSIN